jgi:hypothetical protein
MMVCGVGSPRPIESRLGRRLALREAWPPLPKSVTPIIEELGLKPVAALPNTYLGMMKSQTLKSDFLILLSVIPLKIQKDHYVFSVTINGNTAFKGKVGTMDDLRGWLYTEVLIEDVNVWRDGRAEKDDNVSSTGTK